MSQAFCGLDQRPVAGRTSAMGSGLIELVTWQICTPNLSRELKSQGQHPYQGLYALHLVIMCMILYLDRPLCRRVVDLLFISSGPLCNLERTMATERNMERVRSVSRATTVLDHSPKNGLFGFKCRESRCLENGSTLSGGW